MPKRGENDRADHRTSHATTPSLRVGKRRLPFPALATVHLPIAPIPATGHRGATIRPCPTASRCLIAGRWRFGFVADRRVRGSRDGSARGLLAGLFAVAGRRDWPTGRPGGRRAAVRRPIVDACDGRRGASRTRTPATDRRDVDTVRPTGDVGSAGRRRLALERSVAGPRRGPPRDDGRAGRGPACAAGSTAASPRPARRAAMNSSAVSSVIGRGGVSRSDSSCEWVRMLVSFFSLVGLTSMSPDRAFSPTIIPS